MGRNKIKIEKIENPRIRQITHLKRKKGLIKKAMELSLLCEAQVMLCVLDKNEKITIYLSDKNAMDEFQQYYCESKIIKEKLYNENYKDLFENTNDYEKKHNKDTEEKSIDEEQGVTLNEDIIKEKENLTNDICKNNMENKIIPKDSTNFENDSDKESKRNFIDFICSLNSENSDNLIKKNNCEEKISVFDYELSKNLTNIKADNKNKELLRNILEDQNSIDKSKEKNNEMMNYLNLLSSNKNSSFKNDSNLPNLLFDKNLNKLKKFYETGDQEHTQKINQQNLTNYNNGQNKIYNFKNSNYQETKNFRCNQYQLIGNDENKILNKLDNNFKNNFSNNILAENSLNNNLMQINQNLGSNNNYQDMLQIKRIRNDSNVEKNLLDEIILNKTYNPINKNNIVDNNFLYNIYPFDHYGNYLIFPQQKNLFNGVNINISNNISNNGINDLKRFENNVFTDNKYVFNNHNYDTNQNLDLINQFNNGNIKGLSYCPYEFFNKRNLN